jgi:molybdate transport system substrate-binding protein
LSSADGLKRTLLDAKSIAYSASVSGQYLTKELLQKLGIADAVLGKCRFVGGGERTGAVVARGEADIAFQQMSELLPVPGIAHITPLPADVQKVSLFSAGVGANARHADLARNVIRFLASSDAASAIEKSGLEVVTKG